MLNNMELEVWPTFDNPHVLPLIDVVEDAMENVIFFTPMMKTTLFARLHIQSFKKDPKALERCRTYARQVLRGLAYLHGLGFSHLDLRAENVLLTVEDDRAVIGDFSGLCESGTKNRKCPLPHCYRPPELIGNNGKIFMSEPVDLWSYGLLLANLFLGIGFNVYTNRHKRAGMMKAVLDSKKLFQSEEYVSSCISLTYSSCCLSPKCVKNLINIIGEFLRFDPVERIAAEEALSHAFFKNCPVRKVGKLRALMKNLKGQTSLDPIRRKRIFHAAGKRMLGSSSSSEVETDNSSNKGSEGFDVINESPRKVEAPPQVASAEVKSEGASIWSRFNQSVSQLTAHFLTVPFLSMLRRLDMNTTKEPSNLKN